MPNRVPSPTNDIGKIEIPLPANKFGSFIANLLGKPQTIRNTFFGSFAISHEDISNFFHLVDQRVKEQNRSHLVQFTIRIIYDDGSSYELPNLQDFEKNTEIRPIIATGVTLTWTYLIFFSEKTVPEKQQIEVNIRIRNGDFASSGIIFDALFVRIGSRFPESPFRSSGIINFSISHTMRSWGADIENLLTSHIKSIMKSESRSIPKILNKYSEKMGTISFIICLGALMLLGYQFSENIQRSSLEHYRSTITIDGSTAISAKIDLIAEYLFSYQSLLWSVGSVIFLIISLIISIFVSICVIEFSENTKPSFILITRKSKEYEQELMKKYERRPQVALKIFLANIAVGLIANIIFYYIWR